MNLNRFRLSLWEIFLLQMMVWIGLWLISEYTASLLTIILTPIVLCILIIALASEGIERSKVPRAYFGWMGLSVLAPIVSMLIYWVLNDYTIEWLQH